jgi:hypothetical protein
MVVIAWALLTWICSGIGLAIYALFRVFDHIPEQFTLSFWIGFAALVLSLQMIHLFLPIQAWMIMPTLGVATAGWITERQRVKKSLMSAGSILWIIVPYVLLLIWLLNRATAIVVGVSSRDRGRQCQR